MNDENINLIKGRVMNNNQKQGIAFIIGGILVFMLSVIPQSIGLYNIYDYLGYYFGSFFYYLESFFLIHVISIGLIGFGIIRTLITQGGDSMDRNASSLSQESTNSDSETIKGNSNITKRNKVSRISLMGGLIGALTTNPKLALEGEINRANQEGWVATHIEPHSTTNLFVWILQFVVLFCTLGLFSWGGGYLVLFEKDV